MTSENRRGISLGETLGDLPDESLPAFIRHIYCTEYRVACPAAQDYGDTPIAQWDGGQDSFGRNHRPVWPKLAAFFTNNSVDPISYIRAAFAMRRGRTPPAPNTLTSGEMLTHYYQFVAESRQTIGETWNRQRQAMLTEIASLQRFYKDAPLRTLQITALCDGHRVEANCLLRYCMSVEYQLTELAGDFLRPAAVEYLCHRAAYDAVLPTLPQAVREEAVRLQREMVTPKG